MKAFGLAYDAYNKYYDTMDPSLDYNFVNSGLLMGPAWALLAVVKCMKVNGRKGGKYDDQEALTTCMLQNPSSITIDYAGQLVVDMHMLNDDVIYGAASGRMHSAVSGAMQCFVHFNGNGVDRFPTDHVNLLTAPQNPRCAFLVNLVAPDMVRTGFGSRVGELYFASLRALQNGCDLVVSDEAAINWGNLQLGAFWETAVPAASFQMRWNAGSKCPNFRLKSADNLLRCEFMPDLDVFVPIICNMLPMLNGHASDPLLAMFNPRLSAYRKPYDDRPYTAVHVALEDLVPKSEVFDLATSISKERELWPSDREILISKTVTDQAQSGFVEGLRRKGFLFKTTEDVSHMQEEAFHYTAGDVALEAVLDDLFGLAHASKLVGNYASNIFKLGHALNQRIHGPIGRAPWCFDMLANDDCDTGEKQGDFACQGTEQCWCGEPAKQM